MSHLDRLSSLLRHFQVRSQRMDSTNGSNLFITQRNGNLDKLLLYIDTTLIPEEINDAVAYAQVDFGSKVNPLHQIIPKFLDIDLHKESEVKTIAKLIAVEAKGPRCGGKFALDRLCDLLVVTTLRHRIEQDNLEPGIFAGLAHPKLRHVVVAIHDNPGHLWQIEDFVDLACMSRSQFMSTFQKVLGTSPIAYLKLWRMTAARAAILNGMRIKETAKQYGYGSGDSFCRAFVATYGIPPTKVHELL